MSALLQEAIMLGPYSCPGMDHVTVGGAHCAFEHVPLHSRDSYVQLDQS